MGICLVVATLIVLGIAFAAYKILARDEADEGIGFMEYVEDPTAPDRLHAELTERDAAVAELASRT